MISWVKGLLIVILCSVIAPLGAFLYDKTVLQLLSAHPGGLEGAVLAVLRFFECGVIVLAGKSGLIGGAIFGLVYGLVAGILVIYDLSGPGGWFDLLIDLTWSLPNTIFGFILGNVFYPIFGSPSRADSQDQGWIVYMPRSGGGFGNSVLQTLGTVNLGGSGQHERMHLLQARLFGPAYLAIFGANYVLNFIVQVLWAATLGLVLWLFNVRDTVYFRPPQQSAVQGFFGWIYYATAFELWAYASGNP
jgi:hypothetical protein